MSKKIRLNLTTPPGAPENITGIPKEPDVLQGPPSLKPQKKFYPLSVTPTYREPVHTVSPKHSPTVGGPVAGVVPSGGMFSGNLHPSLPEEGPAVEKLSEEVLTYRRLAEAEARQIERSAEGLVMSNAGKEAVHRYTQARRDQGKKFDR